MIKKKKIINNFTDAVCDLSISNTFTGIWDNRRYQMCKKNIKEISLEKLIQTEKLSRSFVERRAVNRNKIESCIVDFVKLLKQKK